ncbi:toll/interleukin-1 receptor domain-containing protein [Rhizobium sophorae]|uniref:Toll/interleukin-1 receptor domain-containing protein n=1 Tax=Rhizobium sophorae TaxID=1535242 RepID=A0A7Y3SBD2_9HYPH|nr:toll/interleukin-1 receptor domain-containing protein [Rhizobium sophorae]NKL39163.1 TIR domain-containing protein [Rhizobium leguminosarum bv. viciae]NNU40584.1 toll/interleukin-1 receptor domain-containing protein [Rhizobium sophorae]
MPSVFFSFSHADGALRDQLEKQLSMLRRQGVIETWHDRRVGAGDEFEREIDEHINTDDIILLLVSADFLASDYCYDIEMKRAMERHERKEAIVIPVILRACDWKHAPFGKLKGVPEDGRPVTQWTDIDAALLEVAQAVRGAAGRVVGRAPVPATQIPAAMQQPSPRPPTAAPRSSNLSLAKEFTQRDKDAFKLETFEYIVRFFENSLVELSDRNPGYEGVFRRVDANRFFATIYRNGKDVSRGTVYMGGGAWSNGISYAQGETTASNGMSESINVEADDQSIYLKSMGMSSFGGDRDQKLSQEGAAEVLWNVLVRPLKGNAY